MEYIYDIVLNFKDRYYEFYEWKKKDKIINIKKIPIYKIKNKDYLNIKNNEVLINKKTLPKQNKMFLLASNKEIMGVLLNNNGKVIKKSSLICEEADDIMEDISEIKTINILYEIKKVNKNPYLSRIDEDKIKYINNYFKKINIKKDEYLLKYLYYEVFSKTEDNVNIVHKELLKLLKTDINKLYNGIKRVNIELKKLSF